MQWICSEALGPSLHIVQVQVHFFGNDMKMNILEIFMMKTEWSYAVCVETMKDQWLINFRSADATNFLHSFSTDRITKRFVKLLHKTTNLNSLMMTKTFNISTSSASTIYQSQFTNIHFCSTIFAGPIWLTDETKLFNLGKWTSTVEI